MGTFVKVSKNKYFSAWWWYCLYCDKAWYRAHWGPTWKNVMSDVNRHIKYSHPR